MAEGTARIAGTVMIDGEPAARDVVVISDNKGGRQVVGEGRSASDGTFDITYSDWTGPVIALALDNYGQAWESEANLNNGTVVHPTTPNGYVYQVTSAGTTGAEEPAWSTEGSVTDGSVTYEAKPYYRPVASGPLQGEVIEEIEISPLVIEYREADELTHDWETLVGWNHQNVVVDGNALYGGASGNPKAAGRAFSIPADGKGKVTAEFYEEPGANGTRFIGLNFGGAADGIIASLPNFIGAGLDPNYRPVAWIGESFSGDVTIGNNLMNNGSSLGTGLYRTTVAVDEENISVVVTGVDGQGEFSLIVPRSYAPNMGEVTSVIVWNGSTLGTSGSYVKAIGAKASLTPFRTKSNAAGAIEGGSPTVIHRNVSDLWRIQLPEQMDGEEPLPVVVYFHQASTGSAMSPVEEGRLKPVTSALSEAGFILLSANDGGDRWGNQESIDNYSDLIDWVKSSVYCGPVFLLGVSAGAVPALNMLLRQARDDIAGVALICPVCDLEAMYQNASFTSAIDAAYGSTNEAEFLANSSGFNPVSLDAQNFQNIGSRFYVATSGDATVPNSEHTDVFQALIAPYADESEIIEAGVGHLQPEQYQASDLIAFFNRCIARQDS